MAVLLVALSHGGVGFLKGGYVGVDVFFVLSGFLITQLLLSGAAKPRLQSLVDFYSRRARRILPAAALTLAVTDIVAYKLLNFVRAKQALQDSIFASLFTANIHFANQGANYFAQGQPPSPVQNFWSLAVEEQFYLVWPLLLSVVLLGIVIRRRSRRASRPASSPTSQRRRLRLLVVVVLIGGGSLAWSAYYTRTDPAAAYFSTFARAWELALGAALAIGATWVGRGPAAWRAATGWLGAICIGAAAVMFSSRTPFPGTAALLPTVGAALVIGGGLGERQSRFAVGRLLSAAPLPFIGDRSYAFYLWHWPVLIIAMEYEGHNLSLGVNLLLLLGAFLLSMVSYALFENPLRRMRWSLPSHALVLWPASVMAVLIVAGWGVNAINLKATEVADVGAPQYPGLLGESFRDRSVIDGRLPELQAAPGASGEGETLPAVKGAVLEVQRGGPIPSGLLPPVASLLKDNYEPPGNCAAHGTATSSSICNLGDAAGKRTLVVVGDSHAMMWMPAILGMAKQDGWVVHLVAKSGCSPAQWWNVVAATSDCNAWYRWAIRQTHSLRPDVTVIAGDMSSGFVGKAPAAGSGMASLLRKVKQYSKQVVVVEDPPRMVQQPVDCLLAGNANMSRCASSPASDQLAVDEAVAAAVRGEEASYVGTRGWFCFDGYCPMVIGHTIAYRDEEHISATYVSELESVFQAAFRRALGVTRPGDHSPRSNCGPSSRGSHPC